MAPKRLESEMYWFPDSGEFCYGIPNGNLESWQQNSGFPSRRKFQGIPYPGIPDFSLQCIPSCNQVSGSNHGWNQKLGKGKTFRKKVSTLPRWGLKKIKNGIAQFFDVFKKRVEKDHEIGPSLNVVFTHFNPLKTPKSSPNLGKTTTVTYVFMGFGVAFHCPLNVIYNNYFVFISVI